jgi:hypothetical protein
LYRGKYNASKLRFLHENVQPGTFVEEAFFPPSYDFGAFVKTSGDCICMDSYLGPLFCSTGLHFCFCASIILLLLLWLCIIFWSRLLCYLQHCAFCLVLPWLFAVFCACTWTLGLIFQSLWWMYLEFWWESIIFFYKRSSSILDLQDLQCLSQWLNLTLLE